MFEKLRCKLAREEAKVWFLVNKSGFPMDDDSWKQMWAFAAEMHPALFLPKILPEVPVPKAPLKLPHCMPVACKLLQVQKYLSLLQYNYTGTQIFNVKKHLFISSLMRQAKTILKESLPIKCLEAVLVAIYLTNSIKSIDRLPVTFKTTLPQRTCRHVVLVVRHEGLYGSIGLSRSPHLMYKPLSFQTLSDLLVDFVQHYIEDSHKMVSMKVGQCIPHESNSVQPILWNFRKVNCEEKSLEALKKDFDKVARDLKKSNLHWLLCGTTLKQELSKLSKRKLPLLKRSMNKVFVEENGSGDVDEFFELSCGKVSSGVACSVEGGAGEGGEKKSVHSTTSSSLFCQTTNDHNVVPSSDDMMTSAGMHYKLKYFLGNNGTKVDMKGSDKKRLKCSNKKKKRKKSKNLKDD